MLKVGQECGTRFLAAEVKKSLLLMELTICLLYKVFSILASGSDTPKPWHLCITVSDKADEKMGKWATSDVALLFSQK